MAGEKFIALEQTSQEIKTTVEGVNTSVTELKEDVGDSAGTDLVARVANLATQVSNLQTAVNTLMNNAGGAVKSIQRGTYTFTNGDNKTINISTVNASKCIVILNSSLVGASGYTSKTRRLPAYISYLVGMTNSSITISSNYATYADYYSSSSEVTEYEYGTVSYQVIEFY